MKIIKLLLHKLNPRGKSSKAKEIVRDMTGNPNFTTPAPTLATITTQATDLDTAILDAEAAQDTAAAKVVIVHQKEDILVASLNLLANYVENTANGDVAKIRSAGMDVKDTPSPIGELHAPTNFSVTQGDNDGEIDMHWTPVKGAKSYNIDMSTQAIGGGGAVPIPIPSAWQHCTSSTKSSITVKNLTSGVRYYFRVAAFGAAGQSGWSDAITKVVP